MIIKMIEESEKACTRENMSVLEALKEALQCEQCA